MLSERGVSCRDTCRQLRLPRLAVVRLVRVQYHANGKVDSWPSRCQKSGALAHEGCGAWGGEHGNAEGQVRPRVRDEGRELRDVLLCEVRVYGGGIPGFIAVRLGSAGGAGG